jgi:hypothetical protein
MPSSTTPSFAYSAIGGIGVQVQAENAPQLRVVNSSSTSLDGRRKAKTTWQATSHDSVVILRATSFQSFFPLSCTPFLEGPTRKQYFSIPPVDLMEIAVRPVPKPWERRRSTASFTQLERDEAANGLKSRHRGLTGMREER